MAEPWNQWYPHEIDIWQGSGAIQILSDTAYRAVHNILQELWKSEDCALEERELHKASRVLGRYAEVRDEVLAYFDRTEDGRITHFVQRKKWMKAKEGYEKKHGTWNETSEARSAAGRAGAAARWQKHGKPMANVCDRISKPMANDALRVRERVIKKVQVPSRASHEPDPRHVPFRDEVKAYTEAKKVLFTWDGAAAKQLDLLLKACPDLELSLFQKCLLHRARSPGVTHGEHPRSWLPHILKYQEAPLNEFGKTGAANGNRNSKTGGNIDAGEQAKDIIRAQFRGKGAAGGGPADQVLLEAGSSDELGTTGNLRG